MPKREQQSTPIPEKPEGVETTRGNRIRNGWMPLPNDRETIPARKIIKAPEKKAEREDF